MLKCPNGFNTFQTISSISILRCLLAILHLYAVLIANDYLFTNFLKIYGQ